MRFGLKNKSDIHDYVCTVQLFRNIFSQKCIIRFRSPEKIFKLHNKQTITKIAQPSRNY